MYSLTVLGAKSPRSKAGFPRDLSPWHVDGRLLSVSSHHLPSVCVCVLISSSYKDPSQIGLGPIHMTSFYLSHLFKDPHLLIQSHSEVLGVGTPTYGFGWGGGHNSAHNTVPVVFLLKIYNL